MKSNKLRAMQAPLKEQYKENPETAAVTLRAESRMAEGIACKVETRQAIAEADDKTITKQIDLTERYCVVLQTLRNPPAIAVSRNNA